MKITGLDLSLTSTGVAHWHGVPWAPPVIMVVQPKASLGTGHQRLSWLLGKIGTYAADSDFVVLEGPSFGSPNRQHVMGGLWWLVAHGLWRRDVPYVVITPQQRAKYITGKGSSGKVAVAVAVARRYPDVELAGDDQADAFVLAVMAADYLGLPGVVPVPAAQREVLERITWPVQFEDVREALSAQAGSAAG